MPRRLVEDRASIDGNSKKTAKRGRAAKVETNRSGKGKPEEQLAARGRNGRNSRKKKAHQGVTKKTRSKGRLEKEWKKRK